MFVLRAFVICFVFSHQLDDMEAKRLEDLNAAASAEGADDETKARYDQRFRGVVQFFSSRFFSFLSCAFFLLPRGE